MIIIVPQLNRTPADEKSKSSCRILLHLLFNQSEIHLLLSSVVNDILERDLDFFY